MFRSTRLVALVAGLLAGTSGGLVPAARANLFWDFSYTAFGMPVSGILETTETPAGGGYTILGISGSRGTDPITGLVAPGGYDSNDNLLTTSSPFVTENGFAFTAGGYTLRPYYFDLLGKTYEYNSNPFMEDAPVITLSVSRRSTAVPEPVSAALLGAGLLGFAAVRRATRPQPSPAA